MKTYSAKPSEINKSWWLIDAKDLIVGRLASQVAVLLRGKHKPTFTPHMDCGDNVIIINAKYVSFSGKKSDPAGGKNYYRHTGFPGGIKETNAGKILSGRFPERVVKMAIKRMISRNSLGSRQLGNLHVYAEENHPHQAQQPKIFDMVSKNSKNKSRGR